MKIKSNPPGEDWRPEAPGSRPASRASLPPSMTSSVTDLGAEELRWVFEFVLGLCWEWIYQFLGSSQKLPSIVSTYHVIKSFPDTSLALEMNLLPVIHDALGLCLKDKITLSDASTKIIRKFSLSLSTANTKTIIYVLTFTFYYNS